MFQIKKYFIFGLSLAFVDIVYWANKIWYWLKYISFYRPKIQNSLKNLNIIIIIILK